MTPIETLWMGLGIALLFINFMHRSSYLSSPKSALKGKFFRVTEIKITCTQAEVWQILMRDLQGSMYKFAYKDGNKSLVFTTLTNISFWGVFFVVEHQDNKLIVKAKGRSGGNYLGLKKAHNNFVELVESLLKS